MGKILKILAICVFVNMAGCASIPGASVVENSAVGAARVGGAFVPGLSAAASVYALARMKANMATKNHSSSTDQGPAPPVRGRKPICPNTITFSFAEQRLREMGVTDWRCGIFVSRQEAPCLAPTGRVAAFTEEYKARVKILCSDQ